MKFKKIMASLLIAVFILIPAKAYAYYVGSVNSNIYHYTSCKWANEIYPQNRITFDSVSDARNHGYRACKVCCPPSSDPVSTVSSNNYSQDDYVSSQSSSNTSSDDGSNALGYIGAGAGLAGLGYIVGKNKAD